MSINQRPIEVANDADLRLSRAPMQRAALRAREIAARTGTALIFSEDGQLRRMAVEPLSPAVMQVQQPAAAYADKKA
jgi:hypothetical protein